MTFELVTRLLLRKSILVSAAMLVIIGCRGVDSDGGLSEDEGRVELWLSASPVEELDRFDFNVSGVIFKPVGEDPIEIQLDTPLQLDLQRVLSTPRMREEILDDVLPVGRYEWVRLVVDETRLFVSPEGSGEDYRVEIPEAEQDGLQIEQNVLLENDVNLDLTISIELSKSLRDPMDPEGVDPIWGFHPELRVVRTVRSGTLEGSVSLDRVSECDNDVTGRDGNAVYVYSGEANFQDVQGNAGDPLAVARVERDPILNEYDFVLGFLPRGDYTAIFTCDAELDDPETDNRLGMQFSDSVDAEISEGETTTVFFD